MTAPMTVDLAERLIRDRFVDAGIRVSDVQVRRYPDEVAFIVLVAERDLRRSATIGNELDASFATGGLTGFVAVRAAPDAPQRVTGPLRKGVQDERASELAQLLGSRARTSEAQPSLAYIPNAAANISTVTAPRHQLIFGRRGAGKTALLVEAKRRVEEEGALAIWINVQTYRREPSARIFLWAAKRVADLIATNSGKSVALAESAASISRQVEQNLGEMEVSVKDVDRLIPFIQQLIQRFQEVNAQRIFIFLDDFYYITRADQPVLLDMFHACVRDCDAWLKIASIKNLTRWFQPSPPVGLQTGQDADHIDLDVTLEDPQRAKQFLETMLQAYAAELEIRTLSQVYAPEALDRLVLASGAVPRDYLVLGANAIRRAQARENAKLVGVQDVNGAAGDAARTKISELEDDLAASGTSGQALAALQHVRRFCLEERQSTFFAIDFKHKEDHASEYANLTELMDVRLIHLVNASVSDEHRAGERAEIYMLDLSQFSGQRLKKFLRVLDFVRGNIVLKETGKKQPARIGDSPRTLLAILRRAPQFDLEQLRSEAAEPLLSDTSAA